MGDPLATIIMKKTKNLRIGAFITFLALVMIVSNNIITFFENILKIPEALSLVVFVAIVALLDTELVKKLK